MTDRSAASSSLASAANNDGAVVVRHRSTPAQQNPPPNDDEPQQPLALNEAQQAPAEQDGGGWALVKKMAYRVVMFYLISSLIRNFFQPHGGGPAGGNGTATPGAAVSSRSGAAGRPPCDNMFKFGDELDLFIYISESNSFFRSFNDSSALFWHLENVRYGNWEATYEKSGQFDAGHALQNNGSVFLHIFVTRSGFQPDPTLKMFSKKYTFYKSHQLNRYKKKRYQKTTNLLTGKSEQSDEEMKKAETIRAEILSHWHPNLTLNLVTDQTQWAPGAVPPPLDEFVQFEPASNSYYPPLFFNDYWNMLADYQPINETVEKLNFTLTVAPISLFKWQLYAAQSMKNRWSKILGSSSVVSSLFEEEDQQEDQDSLKQALLDTNPYLLGLTVAVSILHTIFEFLAFKNDIQFWRNRKSLEGLSVKSVVFNLMTSVIVLLYIMDNESNFVIKLSVFVGVLIELWKIPKCMDVSLNRESKIFGILPKIIIKDKGSYLKSSTKEYDNLAFRYLSWLLYPLIIGYAVYSLLYQEHRGWYSWVLSMLYGFLLTFGFIMMTPQLFINYKLKSVAHLPWRMLSYKFLNTFIDDIFAFVIKMPTMYRIGCFRDDIVFLVYLYQRWIYRVDPGRLNEFGTSAEMMDAPPSSSNPEVLAVENGGALRRQNEDLSSEAESSPGAARGEGGSSNASAAATNRARAPKTGGGGAAGKTGGAVGGGDSKKNN